jgi:hypothetical protein
MRRVAFHPVGRDQPNSGFEIKFGPTHGADAIATLGRCNQQFYDRAERTTDFVASPQHKPEFIGIQHPIATDGATGLLDSATRRMHERPTFDRPRAHLANDGQRTVCDDWCAAVDDIVKQGMDISAGDVGNRPLTPAWQHIEFKNSPVLAPAALSRVGFGVPLKEAGCDRRDGVVLGFDLTSTKALFFRNYPG